MKDTPILYIVRGLPGSGRGTLARSLGCYHLSEEMFYIQGGARREHDDKMKYAAMRWCYQATVDALEEGMDVVVSGYFHTFKLIHPYLDLTPNPRVYRTTGDFGSSFPTEEYHKMKEAFVDIRGEEYII